MPYTPKTVTEILAEIESNFADNTTYQITPFDARQVLEDIAQSYVNINDAGGGGGGGGGITLGSPIHGGSVSNTILYDNAGNIGEATVGGGLLLSGGVLSAPGSSGGGSQVADIPSLRSLAPPAGVATVWVQDPVRGQSNFDWIPGNHSGTGTAPDFQCPHDPGMGIWVPPFSPGDGSTGAWKRKYDGTKVRARWWGVLSDGVVVDPFGRSTSFAVRNAFASTASGHVGELQLTLSSNQALAEGCSVYVTGIGGITYTASADNYYLVHKLGDNYNITLPGTGPVSGTYTKGGNVAAQMKVTAATAATGLTPPLSWRGAITGLGAITGGSGYTTASNVALGGGSGAGATANITASGGAVTAVTIVHAGSGYKSSPPDSLTIPGGTGGSVLVSAVSAASAVRYTVNSTVGLTSPPNLGPPPDWGDWVGVYGTTVADTPGTAPFPNVNPQVNVIDGTHVDVYNSQIIAGTFSTGVMINQHVLGPWFPAGTDNTQGLTYMQNWAIWHAASGGTTVPGAPIVGQPSPEVTYAFEDGVVLWSLATPVNSVPIPGGNSDGYSITGFFPTPQSTYFWAAGVANLTMECDNGRVTIATVNNHERNGWDYPSFNWEPVVPIYRNIGFITPGAKIQTTVVGSSTCKVINTADLSVFNIGQIIYMTSFDVQFSGGPPSAQFFEYHRIADIDAATGVVTFEEAIEYQHRSDFPDYSVPGASTPIGAARIWAMSVFWDGRTEYRNVTCCGLKGVLNNGGLPNSQYVSMAGREIRTYNWKGAGFSESLAWFITHYDDELELVGEIDKGVSDLVYINCRSQSFGLVCQSPTPKRLTVIGGSYAGLIGCGQHVQAYGASFGIFAPALTDGYSYGGVLSGCRIWDASIGVSNGNLTDVRQLNPLQGDFHTAITAWAISGSDTNLTVTSTTGWPASSAGAPRYFLVTGTGTSLDNAYHSGYVITPGGTTVKLTGVTIAGTGTGTIKDVTQPWYEVVSNIGRIGINKALANYNMLYYAMIPGQTFGLDVVAGYEYYAITGYCAGMVLKVYEDANNYYMDTTLSLPNLTLPFGTFNGNYIKLGAGDVTIDQCFGGDFARNASRACAQGHSYDEYFEYVFNASGSFGNLIGIGGELKEIQVDVQQKSSAGSASIQITLLTADDSAGVKLDTSGPNNGTVIQVDLTKVGLRKINRDGTDLQSTDTFTVYGITGTPGSLPPNRIIANGPGIVNSDSGPVNALTIVKLIFDSKYARRGATYATDYTINHQPLISITGPVP